MTSIEWTDETWNPTVGCDRVSPGCDHCYAMNVAHRGLTAAHRGLTVNGPDGVDWNGVVRLLAERLEVPFRWRRPRRIFVDSMSDLFHPAVPERFIGDVWNTMGLTPQHTYQILTKRPPRMAQVLQGWERQGWTWRRSDMVWCGPIAGPLPNVWLGTSIESSRYAFRADHLRATPAAVRFLSIEPMLDDCAAVDLEGIDWVIVGGESGPGARPMHPGWVRAMRDRCTEAGIPFLFKQWGAWSPSRCYSYWPDDAPGSLIPYRTVRPGAVERLPSHEGAQHFVALVDEHQGFKLLRVGKHDAGRELDGRTWDDYPSNVEVAG